MSEKIFYTPSEATLLAPRPGATAMASATHSPSFAELLAEAEAVQDVVQVGAEAATSAASAHGTGTQPNNTPGNHTQGNSPLDKNTLEKDTLEKDRAGPAMAGLRGRVRGALHSMAGLVMGPLPGWVMAFRDEKLRRGSARG